MRLMRYDFTIFHTPGSGMYIADCLSRPSAGVADKALLESSQTEQYVASVVEEKLDASFQEAELVAACLQDEITCALREYVCNGWPDDVFLLDAEMQKLHSVRDCLSTYGSLVLYGDRLYIPSGLRAKYLERCHEGHQGVTKCRRRAQQVFWWPGCSTDIAEFVSNCEVCVKAGRVKHEPLQEVGLPSGPWVEVGSDLFEFEHDNYLLLVDYYSKWIEVCALPSQTSRSVISSMQTIFSCFGVPKVLRSDNGPCYSSEMFREFAMKWGFRHETSSPRYPESNGMAERAVQTVKSLWCKCENKQSALLAYRSTPLASGFSPGELMFGRPVRTSLGEAVTGGVDYDAYDRRASEQSQVVCDKWNERHRAKHLCELKPGDKVWVKSPVIKVKKERW